MAEVIRYVDPDASGTGTGADWTNAYTSLSAWEAAEQTNLVSDGDWHHVYVRSSSGTADTSKCVIGGWTTGASNYILIEAASGDESLKTGWDATRYRIEITDDHCFWIGEDYVRIAGLQMRVIYSSATGKAAINYYGIEASNDLRVERCRIDHDDNGGNTYSRGIYPQDADIDDLLIRDCIITNWWAAGIDVSYSGATILVYNCDITGTNRDGIHGSSGNTFTVKNCSFYDNGDDIDANGGTFTVQYNAADDDLDTEFTETTNIQPTWADEWDTPGSDFTLKSGGDCIDAGIGPSSDANVSTTDIDGDTRSGATCDIGADEYVAAGGTTHALAGSADSISLLSGAIIRDIQLGGSSDSASLLSGAIGVTRQLVGSTDSVSLLTGAINRAMYLSGSADSVSLLSGTLDLELQLSGSADSVSLLSGTLTTASGVHQLSGSVDSVSLASGAITVLRSLAGSADSLSAAGGAINVKLQLVGSADSISLISGAVGLDIKLSGSADSISLLSGTLGDEGEIATGVIYATVTPRQLSVLATARRPSIAVNDRRLSVTVTTKTA